RAGSEIVNNNNVKVFQCCRDLWHRTCAQRFNLDRASLALRRQRNVGKRAQAGGLAGSLIEEKADKNIAAAKCAQGGGLSRYRLIIRIEQINGNILRCSCSAKGERDVERYLFLRAIWQADRLLINIGRA